MRGVPTRLLMGVNQRLVSDADKLDGRKGLLPVSRPRRPDCALEGCGTSSWTVRRVLRAGSSGADRRCGDDVLQLGRVRLRRTPYRDLNSAREQESSDTPVRFRSDLKTGSGPVGPAIPSEDTRPFRALIPC